MKYCKLFIAMIAVMLLSSCISPKERALRKTPEEVARWSDEHLCVNAYWKNPAIKSELLKRKLVSEEEYDYLYVSDVHGNFPRIGMRKCAIWTFTYDADLINQSTMPDGSVQELWKVSKGERTFVFWGGFYYLITIKNDFITDVSELK
jgi:hypothetical protein